MADESDGFLRVTFRGGRFDRHSIPVDVLAELVTLQQALFELASAEFKRRHAERKYLPRGFAESARLYLTETERNCFTASMDRNAAPTLPGLDPEAIDIVVWARGTMLDAFEGRLPPTVSQRELKALARVGDRLSAGEVMELRMRPNTSPSRVDHASRARIAIALHEDLEQVADLEGEVEGVEDRRSTFALKLSDRRTVSVPFERAEKADVVEALDRRPVARVRVRGRVQWSTPPKLLEVNELEVFDHERRPEIDALWKRIDSLAEVPNGWLDGDGLAPSAEALARVREVLARLLADHHEIPRPKVFPTPEGGLQAEWVFGCVSADACFQRDGLTVCSAVSTAHERELDATFEENEVTRFDAALLAQWLMKARSL